LFTGLIEDSKEIKCAFYDLNYEILIDKFIQYNASIILEDDNSMDDFLTGRSYAKMHNKFCIFDDETILTGSMNPTDRGITKNDNNVVVINSKYFVKNYLDEFDEFVNNKYGKGNMVKYREVMFNNNIKIKNLFCPEDECQKNVLEILDNANQSIHFMTFSFTDVLIADKLVEKNDKGLAVEGVYEKTRYNNKYEKYKFLNESGVKVIPDKNKYNMHHKVFIIDNEIVITGSYNPTMSGNERNDENILIIFDEEIALRYLDEYERLVG